MTTIISGASNLWVVLQADVPVTPLQYSSDRAPAKWLAGMPCYPGAQTCPCPLLFATLSSPLSCSCVFKLHLQSSLISPLPARALCAKLHLLVIFLNDLFFFASELWRNFPCSKSDGTEEGVAVSSIAALWPFSGDCMYLTIVSMVEPSSLAPPPPLLLLFSFPRIHLTYLPSIFHSSLGMIMMIGSCPAAIWGPPSFLTNHYLHFHYSYCSLHMLWLYRFLSFFVLFFSLFHEPGRICCSDWPKGTH